MSEEEKELIKKFENQIGLVYLPSNFSEGTFSMNINLDDLKILLKVIDRLQKEIEQEKEKNEEYEEVWNCQNQTIDTLNYTIKKLQKEIEQEKQKNIDLKGEVEKKHWVHIKENGEVEPLFYVSKDEIREILADVIFTLNLPDVSNETKFYMTGVKNSLEDLLREN